MMKFLSSTSEEGRSRFHILESLQNFKDFKTFPKERHWRSIHNAEDHLSEYHSKRKHPIFLRVSCIKLATTIVKLRLFPRWSPLRVHMKIMRKIEDIWLRISTLDFLLECSFKSDRLILADSGLIPMKHKEYQMEYERKVNPFS